MTVTVICIDTRDRRLPVFVASMTEAFGGLVLRVAAQLGGLSELIADQFDRRLTLEYPLVVLTGGYQAQSSAGFTEVLGTRPENRRIVIGGAGFGYIKYLESGTQRVGDALRRFKENLPAVLLPPGCVVSRVSGTGYGSNHAVAEASRIGLEMMTGKGRIIISEGQSDRVSGWQIVPQRHAVDSGRFDWPEGLTIPVEHKSEVFDPEEVAISDAVRAFGTAMGAFEFPERQWAWMASELLAALLIPSGLPEGFEAVVEKLGHERVVELMQTRRQRRELDRRFEIKAVEGGLALWTALRSDFTNTSREVLRVAVEPVFEPALAEVTVVEEAPARRPGRRRSRERVRETEPASAPVEPEEDEFAGFDETPAE